MSPSERHLAAVVIQKSPRGIFININFNPIMEKLIWPIIKRGVKLIIHSQTSQQSKFTTYFIPHVLGMWLLAQRNETRNANAVFIYMSYGNTFYRDRWCFLRIYVTYPMAVQCHKYCISFFHIYAYICTYVYIYIYIYIYPNILAVIHVGHIYCVLSWCTRFGMSVLLAICEGNPSVTGGFLS